MFSDGRQKLLHASPFGVYSTTEGALPDLTYDLVTLSSLWVDWNFGKTLSTPDGARIGVELSVVADAVNSALRRRLSARCAKLVHARLAVLRQRFFAFAYSLSIDLEGIVKSNSAMTPVTSWRARHESACLLCHQLGLFRLVPTSVHYEAYRPLLRLQVGELTGTSR